MVTTYDFSIAMVLGAILFACVCLGILALLLRDSTRGLGIGLLSGLGVTAIVGGGAAFVFLMQSGSESIVEVAPLPLELPGIPLSESGAEPAAGKPAWIDREPGLQGTEYQIPVASDPKLTVAECEQDLAPKLLKAAEAYRNDYLGPQSSLLPPLALSYVSARLLKSEHPLYVETVKTSVGEMKRVHALLVVDRPTQGDLTRALQQVRSWRKVHQLGGVGAVLLASLGVMFAYLKVDTATKGYYTGRLQAVAVVLILAMIGLLVI